MKKLKITKMEDLSGGNSRVALCGMILREMMMGAGSRKRILDAANAFETFGCGAFY